MENFKLVTVGDGAVGKSCLLITYTTNSFPSKYVPTIFGKYSANVMVDGQPANLALFDTGLQEDYDCAPDRMSYDRLCYPQTDVFLLCFSVENQYSLDNIKYKWEPELRHHCPLVPVIMVACKTDLRVDSSTKSPIISYKEGKAVADELGYRYLETSSLTHDGVQNCFQVALRAAWRYSYSTSKKKGGFFSRNKRRIPPPPEMPPAGNSPWIEIETSCFADQWQRMLESPSHTDVVFIVGNNHRIAAHKVVLCAASKLFAKILGVTESSKSNQLRKLGTGPFSRDEINNSKVPGISSVYEERSEDKNRQYTVVEMTSQVPAKAFGHMLEFLYTGVHSLTSDSGEDDIESLRDISRLFHIPELETTCENIVNDEEFLIPSIGTYLNDETGRRLKDMFLNEDKMADIIFNVEGTKIYAHKAVVAARCEVLAAMFSDNFSEGNTQKSEVVILDASVDCFLALLEYLYTDHAPIEDDDSLGIMMLADRYCQSRLINLCELYITKEIDRSCSQNIELSEIDVIGVLMTSQLFNATQLSNWCLHFISTNYVAFKKRSEFKQLTGPNLDHVEENQWPPVSYLNEVTEYNQKYGSKTDRCIVM